MHGSRGGEHSKSYKICTFACIKYTNQKKRPCIFKHCCQSQSICSYASYSSCCQLAKIIQTKKSCSGQSNSCITIRQSKHLAY